MNDYLTELDHDGLLSSTPSAFPPPATMQNDNDMLPNFAQAALLLQNSSGVYSRKVEYLHSLVYKTLHSLIDEMNKHSKKHTSMNKPGGGQQQRGMDEAIYNFQQFDSDLQFLLLDDVLPIDVHGTKINLKQSDLNIDEVNDNNAIAGTTTTTNDTNNNNNNNNGNNTTVLNSTRLSIGLVLDDQCDLTNNANGPSSRSLNATSETMGNGMNTSLRLMNGSCHVHAGTGTLLMPGTSTAMQPMFQQYDNKVDVHAADFNNVTDQTDISMQERDYCNDDANNENDDNHVVFENDDYDNDDDDEGVGFELNGHNDDQQIALHLHQGITSSINEHPIIQDPWEMLLDPHDNANSKVKPMKFGKTIRIPFDCGELPSYAVTGSKSKSSKKRKNPNDSVSKVIHQKNGKNSSVNEDNKWWNKCIATHSYNATISNLKEDYARRKSEGTINKIDNGNDDETFVTNVERKPVMHELPIHGHLFQNEFQYIAQENQAFKTMEKRKKKAQDKINNDKNNDMVVDSAAAALSKERFNDMYEGDNDSVGVNEDVVDFGYGNDYGDDDDDQDGGDNFNYDDNNDDEFDNAFSNHENESKYESTTFEELCRAHLKEFAKGAAKFAVETDLTKRVSSWQEKLAVILEEEDSRNEFNIGTYSNKIIAGVQKQTEKDKNPNSKKVRKMIVTDQFMYIPLTYYSPMSCHMP